ncbi:GNAT family N-acetyltransferase [Phenylobacterium sp.]|uniref:GNAT family N-acetyltransferase n=1 Tax=Phenylobacterium sp. TaxID=1871053 RepID=UPI002F3FE232
MIAESGSRPILETPRLRLSPLVIEDAAHIFPIMNDREVMAHWDCGEIDDPELVAEIVRGQVADMDAGRSIHWAIAALDGGAFLGCCDLEAIDRWHRRAEVGFILDRAAWGQGYALEAMRSVVGYAAVCGVRKLGARTHLGNRRSENLLSELGFEEEGVLRGHVLRDGERRDCHLFGLLL